MGISRNTEMTACRDLCKRHNLSKKSNSALLQRVLELTINVLYCMAMWRNVLQCDVMSCQVMSVRLPLEWACHNDNDTLRSPSSVE